MVSFSLFSLFDVCFGSRLFYASSSCRLQLRDVSQAKIFRTFGSSPTRDVMRRAFENVSGMKNNEDFEQATTESTTHTYPAKADLNETIVSCLGEFSIVFYYYFQWQRNRYLYSEVQSGRMFVERRIDVLVVGHNMCLSRQR
jgi:hypothetical protein